MHCDNLNADRAQGEATEIDFAERLIKVKGAELVAAHPWVWEALGVAGQPLRPDSPGDVFFRLHGVGYPAEIKGKKPRDLYGDFGLEDYRLALLTNPSALYLIRDGRDGRWLVATIRDLITRTKNGSARLESGSDSWVGGEKQKRPIWYWPAECWIDFRSWVTTKSKRDAEGRVWHTCPECGLQGPALPGESYCRRHGKRETAQT